MQPLTKPLFVFDGTCGFCRKWVARWRRATGDRVDYAPFQEAAARFPEIPPERFAAAAQLIEPGGRRSEGAEAVFRSLAQAPGRGWPLWLYDHVPGFAAVSDWCYRRIARHRPLCDRVTDAVWGPHVVPPGETLTAWIFLRLLGIVAALAFVSLALQIKGLAGTEGILPAREFLDAVRSHYGAMSPALVPTLCWFGASDAALLGMSVAGVAFSLLLAAGIAPVASLVGVWVLYLSLASAGQEFFYFQWDALLLETTFLSLFLAPWRWRSRPRDDPPPPRAALWLLRWLLFRLVFSSAVVKLSSGDPTWRHLTALTWHYQTQPLPPWTAWYAHQLPAWFQKLSAAVMFAIEGLVPFFIAAPRRIRFAAAGMLAGLQLLILVTGNYGIFNLLTIALCALLLDDGVWPRRRSARARTDLAEPEPRAHAGVAWPARALRPIAAALVVLSLVPLTNAFRWPVTWLGPVAIGHRALSPFQLSNSYGLFAVMTTERDEIDVEGSDDGVTWRSYPFRWKPGDPMREPAFVAPHMPRLDWQMWFASLGDVRRETWFLRFCDRLLRGSRPVTALLESTPFPRSPPRFVRALFWDYRFTNAATRRATGAWWRRELRGLYCPVLTLVDGRLAAVESDSLGNVIRGAP